MKAIQFQVVRSEPTGDAWIVALREDGVLFARMILTNPGRLPSERGWLRIGDLPDEP